VSGAKVPRTVTLSKYPFWSAPVAMGVNHGLREWIYELGKLGVVKQAERIIDAPKVETPPQLSVRAPGS
jgi:hypothetical protein